MAHAAEDEPEAEPAPAPRRRRKWVFVALAALFAALAIAAVVIHVQTNEGELVIEVDDPNIEVKVVRGETLVADVSTGRNWVLKAGDGKVTFYDPVTGAEAITETFTIKRGDKTVVRASMADIVAKRSPKPKPVPKK